MHHTDDDSFFFCFAVSYFHPWRWYCRLCNIGLVWYVYNLRGFCGRSRGPADFGRRTVDGGGPPPGLYAKSVPHPRREDVFVCFSDVAVVFAGLPVPCCVIHLIRRNCLLLVDIVGPFWVRIFSVGAFASSIKSLSTIYYRKIHGWSPSIAH